MRLFSSLSVDKLRHLVDIETHKPTPEKMRLARKKFEDPCGRPPHRSFMPLTGSA